MASVRPLKSSYGVTSAVSGKLICTSGAFAFFSCDGAPPQPLRPHASNTKGSQTHRDMMDFTSCDRFGRLAQRSTARLPALCAPGRVGVFLADFVPEPPG